MEVHNLVVVCAELHVECICVRSHNAQHAASLSYPHFDGGSKFEVNRRSLEDVSAMYSNCQAPQHLAESTTAVVSIIERKMGLDIDELCVFQDAFSYQRVERILTMTFNQESIAS